MGSIQGIVLRIKRYLGHNTRELGDTVSVQDKNRDESRLLSGTLDEVAGCGLGGREEGLAGGGRLWCRVGWGNGLFGW